MDAKRFTYYTGYEVDNEPSDDEDDDIPYKALQNKDSNSESSSDEFDEPIRKFMGQREFQSKNKSQSKTTTCETFANEMDNELDQIYHDFIARGSFDLPISTQKQSSKEAEASRNSHSTDDDDDDTSKPVKTNEEEANDDLLYDPDEEQEDEKWMTQQRIKSQGGSTEGKTENPTVGPTDAVLNCPGCMVLICHDCQRHETIKNQYRAMFVFHCKVDESRTVNPLNAEASNSKRKLKKGKRLKIEENQDNENLDDQLKNDTDILRPVQCTECGTEVGVYEPKEELYHFANVLASH